MSRQQATDDLVIANGQTVSNQIPGERLRHTRELCIFAPATLPETVTVEVAPGPSPQAADFRALQSDGADITLTAGKATVITAVAFQSLRLVADAGVGADRTFQVVVLDDSR